MLLCSLFSKACKKKTKYVRSIFIFSAIISFWLLLRSWPYKAVSTSMSSWDGALYRHEDITTLSWAITKTIKSYNVSYISMTIFLTGIPFCYRFFVWSPRRSLTCWEILCALRWGRQIVFIEYPPPLPPIPWFTRFHATCVIAHFSKNKGSLWLWFKIIFCERIIWNFIKLYQQNKEFVQHL